MELNGWIGREVARCISHSNIIPVTAERCTDTGSTRSFTKVWGSFPAPPVSGPRWQPRHSWCWSTRYRTSPLPEAGKAWAIWFCCRPGWRTTLSGPGICRGYNPADSMSRGSVPDGTSRSGTNGGMKVRYPEGLQGSRAGDIPLAMRNLSSPTGSTF